MTIRTFIKWTGGGWESITTPDIFINTKTTAVTIISDFNSYTISPEDTIGKIDTSTGTSVVTQNIGSVTPETILDVADKVSDILAENKDPFFHIRYVTGEYIINEDEDIGKLIRTGSCEGCYLTNVDLSQFDLRGVNLSNAVFKGKELVNLDFSEAILHKANFSNTLIRGVKFTYSDLSYADFSHAGFGSINLPPMRLDENGEIDEENGNTYYSIEEFNDFTGADLQSASFEEANLYYINFSEAKMQSVNFSEAKIDVTLFNQVDLTGSIFIEADIYRPSYLAQASSLKYADFSDTSLISGSSDYSEASTTYFANLDLTGTKFVNTDLQEVIFLNSNLTDADFSGANMINANLDGTILKNTVFSSSTVLTKSSFKDAYIETDLSEISLSGMNFSRAILKNMDFSGYNLDEAIFRSALLSGINFNNASVTDTIFSSAVIENSVWTDNTEINKTCASESTGGCN